MLRENGDNDQGSEKLSQALGLFADLKMEREVARTRELLRG
jgi:hypothetical protein